MRGPQILKPQLKGKLSVTQKVDLTSQDFGYVGMFRIRYGTLSFSPGN